MLENLPHFQRHLPDDLAKVNAVINQAVQSDVALISQIGTYIISAGGSACVRLSPFWQAKQSGMTMKTVLLAAMVEFIHTSTLLHDDVVDESDLRRGRKTANNLFGNAAAVLVGDFPLYTRLPTDGWFWQHAHLGSDGRCDQHHRRRRSHQLMNIGNTDKHRRAIRPSYPIQNSKTV